MHRQGRKIQLLLYLALLALLVAAPSAGAQAQGVHIDPGGPAGQEYAIPSVAALGSSGTPPKAGGRGGSGHGNSTPSTTAAPGLFGRGVARKPHAAARGAAPAGRAKHAAAHGHKRATAAPQRRTASPTAWAKLSAGDSSIAWLVPAIALAVLLGGGLVALAARRLGATEAL